MCFTHAHPIIPFYTKCIVFSCVIYSLLSFMAIRPHSTGLCFTFELFNLQLELALPGNYNVYVRLERLKVNAFDVAHTETEKVTEMCFQAKKWLLRFVIMCVA